MDITQLILDDHHEQRRLFAMLEQIDRTDTGTLAAVWARLAAFLDLHAEAEEQLFYPALLHLGRGVGGSHTPDEETEDAIRDHNDIRDAVAKVAEEIGAPGSFPLTQLWPQRRSSMASPTAVRRCREAGLAGDQIGEFAGSADATVAVSGRV